MAQNKPVSGNMQDYELITSEGLEDLINNLQTGHNFSRKKKEKRKRASVSQRSPLPASKQMSAGPVRSVLKEKCKISANPAGMSHAESLLSALRTERTLKEVKHEDVVTPPKQTGSASLSVYNRPMAHGY